MRLSHVAGPDADTYTEVLGAIVPQLDGAEYAFLSTDAFVALERHEMNCVYCTELLFRAHWAAAGTLFRMQRWLSATDCAYRSGNAFAFAAA